MVLRLSHSACTGHYGNSGKKVVTRAYVSLNKLASSWDSRENEGGGTLFHLPFLVPMCCEDLPTPKIM